MQGKFGLSADAEVNYEVFLAGLHPEDRDRTDQTVQRALDFSSGGEFKLEYRTVGLEDGVQRWVAARGKAFFDGAGQAVRFIGTVLDVTERKHNEEELRTLAAFPELNPAPLLRLDRERRVILANSVASKFFSAPDLVGRE